MKKRASAPPRLCASALMIFLCGSVWKPATAPDFHLGPVFTAPTISQRAPTPSFDSIAAYHKGQGRAETSHLEGRSAALWLALPPTGNRAWVLRIPARPP